MLFRKTRVKLCIIIFISKFDKNKNVVDLPGFLNRQGMVNFYTQDCNFVFKEKVLTRKWLKLVAESEIKRLGDIAVIFCSDNYILDVNRRYLEHDYFTDIITFDYCEDAVKLSGDLFISVDSVRENAVEYGAEFADELNRVIVHGLLHLIGYDDHTEEDVAQMRSKENYYLSLRELL